MQIVYQGEFGHVNERVVDSQVHSWDEYGTIISDAVAQTIASWWHSPGSPNSTLLSTRGIVTTDMCLDDFASAAEFLLTSFHEQTTLEALEAYIGNKQGEHNASE